MARHWSQNLTRYAFAAGALCLAVPAMAFAAPPSWTVDKAASRLGFSSSFGGEAFQGSFRRWDAEIVFDPKQLAASKAVVTVDMASASTGDESRDEALPSSDWFNAAKFPKATFATRSIKGLGGDRYEAQADLTIRGVTKPVVLPFTLAIAADQAKMNGQVVIDRNAFGVGQGQFAAAETVPLEVTVTVALSAHRAK